MAQAHLFRFPGAVWSPKRGCVELDEGDVIALHWWSSGFSNLGFGFGSTAAFAAGTARHQLGGCSRAENIDPATLAGSCFGAGHRRTFTPPPVVRSLSQSGPDLLNLNSSIASQLAARKDHSMLP